MDEEVVPKKKQEALDGPVLSERDKAKIERRKRKEERQREVLIQWRNYKYSFDAIFFSRFYPEIFVPFIGMGW